jgi:microsomal dipeptidase-like Zn-dependent dipeptidase
MAAEAASRYGADKIGIGSDLCQDQPDSVVDWMRTGRWSKVADFGEGSAAAPGFPPQPAFFRSNLDFRGLREGLLAAGFSGAEADGVMGDNWLRFYAQGFAPL